MNSRLEIKMYCNRLNWIFELLVHLICVIIALSTSQLERFSDFITKLSKSDNVRLTLVRWCVPGRKTSVVLEWREWLEVTANWERVRHGCTVQRSTELAVMHM